MKMPRDISGEELARLLEKFGYVATRQTGSHLRLTTQLGGEHHITIPRHSEIKVGTLNAILTDVAAHFGADKSEIIDALFAGC